MKQKTTIYPPTMVAMAFILLAVDSGVSSGSIYDKLSIKGQAGQAFSFTLMFALVLFSISFTAFLKGLELAHQSHSPKRTTNLAVLGVAVSFLMAISILMNAWFIGGDAMRQEWLTTQIEKRISKGTAINKLFQYAEDEKISLKTIQETSRNWLSCERASGCVGKEGGGDGQTTLVLSSYLSVADKALNEILEVSNEYEPIIKRIQESQLRLDFVAEMDHLSFDEKLEQAELELAGLISSLIELKNLLPIQTFVALEDSFDTSTNQYIAQGISTVGARTLFNYFNKHAERYADITRQLKRGNLVQIQQLAKPSDFEVLTTSSNAMFIWLMAVVLACFGWIMLGIHVIQNTRREEPELDSKAPHTPAIETKEAVSFVPSSISVHSKH